MRRNINKRGTKSQMSFENIHSYSLREFVLTIENWENTYDICLSYAPRDLSVR